MNTYFIRHSVTDNIKIGQSENPEQRLSDLQSGAGGAELSLLGYTDQVSESDLHNRFNHLRVKGEWFKPENELLDFIKHICGNIAVFNAGDNSYYLEIIDKNNEKWITRKQLEQALGTKNLGTLHNRLVKDNELIENIHYSGFINDSLMNPPANPPENIGGNPNIIIYSYRGIIRICFASRGQRAKHFRDWAENILYNIMVSQQPCITNAVPEQYNYKKACDFYKNEVGVMMISGHTRKDACCLAWSKTLLETGVDLVSSINPDFLRSSYKCPDNNLSKLILAGALACVRNGINPTYKAIRNRSRKIKQISRKNFDKAAYLLEINGRIKTGLNKQGTKKLYVPVIKEYR